MQRTLTIAGSDSGGGAGIQADLKTFQELQTFGMSVITALTAQNSTGVHGVYPQSPEAVQAQLDAVLSDIGVDAVKTGMLFSPEIIETVAHTLRAYQVEQIVIDPVMIAKGGHSLLQEDAIEAIIEHLIPQAMVITPNIPEAEVITGKKRITSLADMKDAAVHLHRLGARHVVIKGGHLLEDKSTDILYDGDEFYTYTVDRVNTKHTHGTGCTFAAAIATGLAKGHSVPEAVQTAKDFITSAIRHSLAIGQGIGSTHHGAYRLLRE